MKDIFGSDVTLGGAWVLDGAILSIEGGNDLVAVGCDMQYGRDISEYRPLNQNKRYLVAGLGVGSINIATIIGPSSGVAAFLKRYSDICQAASNTILIKPIGPKSCTGGQPVMFKAGGCVLQSLTVNTSTQGQMTMVNSTTVLRINSLDVQ